jgi:hypothetical protein
MPLRAIPGKRRPGIATSTIKGLGPRPLRIACVFTKEILRPSGDQSVNLILAAGEAGNRNQTAVAGRSSSGRGALGSIIPG